MKLTRIGPGDYLSDDGKVAIRRVVSRQTYHKDEVVWETVIDGKSLPLCADTKRDAVNAAEQALEKRKA